MNTRYLVYQAYGNVAIIHELIYSVYSLIEVYGGRPPFQIVIYTDNLAFLKEWLPDWVEYSVLDEERLRNWAGPRQFVHRVKVMMLLDFMQNHSGLLLYADTDTVFIHPIDRYFDAVEASGHVMHLDEGVIGQRSNLVFSKVDAFLKNHPEFGIDSTTRMYNAGIIGLSSMDRSLVKEVLALTDRLYAVFPKHIVEQLAFSFVLVKKGPVVEAHEAVYHYWNFKEFRAVLHEFFTFYKGQPYQVVSPKISQINPERLSRPKLAYEQLPFWKKAVRKLKKPRWQLPPYTLS